MKRVYWGLILAWLRMARALTPELFGKGASASKPTSPASRAVSYGSPPGCEPVIPASAC